MTSQTEPTLRYYEMLLPEQLAAFERLIATNQETAILRAPVRLGVPREYSVYVHGQYVTTRTTLEEAHAALQQAQRANTRAVLWSSQRWVSSGRAWA